MSADNPRSVEEIYQNYFQRKQGLLRALTEDVNDFYSRCDPERENLCLYGEANGNWLVDLPAEEVPPELPEPCLGINFARDGMQKKDWLALVAVHSDAWLLAVAFYYGAKLDSHGRSILFNQINSSPTLFEIVTGKANKGQMKSEATGKRGHRPGSSGRLLTYESITPALKGLRAELFWPDDETWYEVTILSVNTRQKSARIQYATGEVEDLDLDEIVREGHMALT